MGATVERASSFPLSASCLVNRAEMLSLVERARAELPVELDEAAALLLAHQDVISRAEDEAEQVLAAARARADEMITDSALVATARGRSEQILDAARTEAARLLREADEYCDRRLAIFEDDLERAMAQVRRGRDRLRERSDLASLDTLHAHGTDAVGADEAEAVEYEGQYSEDGQYVEEGQYVEDGQYVEEAQYEEGYVEAAEYVEEVAYVEVEVYDGRSDEQASDQGAQAGESSGAGEPGEVDPAWDRRPVGVGAQREHRVVDVAGMERAEAERAGLGHRVNLQ
jgi:vacuolar-type H+-ATPase subunit H